MTHPIQLEKTPIIDAVCDFRFKSSQPESVIPVLIANDLTIAHSLKPLPINQLPENLRKQDPNLRYAPLQEALLDGYSVKLGGNIANVSSTIPYQGWDKFKNITSRVMDAVAKSDEDLKYERIAHRVVNFFPNLDISSKLKLKIKDPVNLESPSYEYIRVFQGDNGLMVRVAILSSAANVVLANTTESQSGSIIDIDTYWVNNDMDSTFDPLVVLGNCHDLGKRVFFDLLTEEFTNEMGPTYA